MHMCKQLAHTCYLIVEQPQLNSIPLKCESNTNPLSHMVAYLGTYLAKFSHNIWTHSNSLHVGGTSVVMRRCCVHHKTTLKLQHLQQLTSVITEKYYSSETMYHGMSQHTAYQLVVLPNRTVLLKLSNTSHFNNVACYLTLVVQLWIIICVLICGMLTVSSSTVLLVILLTDMLCVIKRYPMTVSTVKTSHVMPKFTLSS